MTYYLVVFAAGFAGSFHCIGMCGGFACALGRDPRGRGATMVRHLLYNSGRLTTYCFLGALAGALGQVHMYPAGINVHAARRLAGRRRACSRDYRRTAHDRDGVAVLRPAAGVSSPDGRLRQQHVRAVAAQLVDDPQSRRAARFRGVQRLPAVSAGLCLCGRSGEHLPGVAGFLTMASFGLGTFPAMLMMGGVGRVIAPAWRQRGVRLAGACILAARPDHARPWHCCHWARTCRTACWEGTPYDRVGRELVPPLFAAGRPTRPAANRQRRKLRVLLLRLLDRFPGEERQDRRMGSRLASDPPRRRRFSVHEHHAVQPAHLWRRLHRRRCQAASLSSTSSSWFWRPRR